MRVPPPPQVRPIERLSYSQCEAGLRCIARLAWSVSRERAPLPDTPGALLGQAFHAVLREAHAGRLGDDAGTAREAARQVFDHEAAGAWRSAHDLLRLKFREPRRMPFYNVKREEAAALAVLATAATHHPAGGGHAGVGTPRVHGSERWLESRDGLLVGRADYVDRFQRAIIDYKSGRAGEVNSLGISAEESRQLRFYAHLARENGAVIDFGVIVRGDGRRSQVQLTSSEAEAEGAQAREILRCYNAAVSGKAAFRELAVASEHACGGCACVPFCDAFWERADPSWSESCGTHLEGTVRECSASRVYGARLVQLRLAPSRGTFRAPGDVEVQQLPAEWLEVGGDAAPAPGALLRIVHARGDEDRPAVLRGDKAATAIWQV
jgi:hypothetical protein